MKSEILLRYLKRGKTLRVAADVVISRALIGHMQMGNNLHRCAREFVDKRPRTEL